MEEARQYSALTWEQRLFSSVYLGGSVILVASICLQIFLRIDALFPAILAVGWPVLGIITVLQTLTMFMRLLRRQHGFKV